MSTTQIDPVAYLAAFVTAIVLAIVAQFGPAIGPSTPLVQFVQFALVGVLPLVVFFIADT